MKPDKNIEPQEKFEYKRDYKYDPYSVSKRFGHPDEITIVKFYGPRENCIWDWDIQITEGEYSYEGASVRVNISLNAVAVLKNDKLCNAIIALENCMTLDEVEEVFKKHGIPEAPVKIRNGAPYINGQVALQDGDRMTVVHFDEK